MAVNANWPRDQSTSDISIVSNMYLWISHLFQYMRGPLLITVEITFQQIGKEEKFQNGKHDKELKQDNSPEPSTPGHLSETLIVKSVYFSEHSILYLQLLIYLLSKQYQMYYFY